MNKKYPITFRIQEEYRNALRIAYENIYGRRGKSKWICEAIELLLNKDDFVELVVLDTVPSNLCRYPEQFMATEEIRIILDKKILEARRQYPQLEGVQSSIIRTAIIQRLLRQ